MPHRAIVALLVLVVFFSGCSALSGSASDTSTPAETIGGTDSGTTTAEGNATMTAMSPNMTVATTVVVNRTAGTETAAATAPPTATGTSVATDTTTGTNTSSGTATDTTTEVPENDTSADTNSDGSEGSQSEHTPETATVETTTAGVASNSNVSFPQFAPGESYDANSGITISVSNPRSFGTDHGYADPGNQILEVDVAVKNTVSGTRNAPYYKTFVLVDDGKQYAAIGGEYNSGEILPDQTYSAGLDFEVPQHIDGDFAVVWLGPFDKDTSPKAFWLFSSENIASGGTKTVAPTGTPTSTATTTQTPTPTPAPTETPTVKTTPTTTATATDVPTSAETETATPTATTTATATATEPRTATEDEG